MSEVGTKRKIRVGRKFVAFLLCLVTFIVIGIVGKGSEMAPYIVGLFVAYTTGNVAQKATMKDQVIAKETVTKESADER